MLKQSNLTEVLEWAERALDRVDEDSFFTHFDTDDAVQYFYEPFLEAFDSELRKRYGVWYTPKEVVTYMVERVDIALRDELDIHDGLADEEFTCSTRAQVRVPTFWKWPVV
jgi:type I restriction-modification system DNA methylase subunit